MHGADINACMHCANKSMNNIDNKKEKTGAEYYC